MKTLSFLGLLLLLASSAEAGSTCSAILADYQQRGFEAMFAPAYSPSLQHQGGPISPANMSKEVTAAELKRLEVSTPIVAAQKKLSTTNANTLKSWLNSNAGATVPSWLSTAVGVLVPEAWVGIAADVFLQLVNGSGDAGRQQAANLAGTVSEGGVVGVTERIAKDGSGARKFLWTYEYQASLNGKLITAVLAACSADVVVK